MIYHRREEEKERGEEGGKEEERRGEERRGDKDGPGADMTPTYDAVRYYCSFNIAQITSTRPLHIHIHIHIPICIHSLPHIQQHCSVPWSCGSIGRDGRGEERRGKERRGDEEQTTTPSSAVPYLLCCIGI